MEKVEQEKKIYAQAIHNESKRANYPFISINCTTFSKEELERELFGLDENIFYDDKRRKIGLLQLVDGGTLFLDEISELDYSLQTKLLHVLLIFYLLLVEMFLHLLIYQKIKLQI